MEAQRRRWSPGLPIGHHGSVRQVGPCQRATKEHARAHTAPASSNGPSRLMGYYRSQTGSGRVAERPRRLGTFRLKSSHERVPFRDFPESTVTCRRRALGDVYGAPGPSRRGGLPDRPLRTVAMSSRAVWLATLGALWGFPHARGVPARCPSRAPWLRWPPLCLWCCWRGG